MVNVCPRPCSRLATGTVFISIGVVQFVAGIILLRSQYVYLLSGPDFWTACSNIAVGCLLCVSAVVWKKSRKQQSMKHVVRRNVLLALQFSALIINSSTLGIMLLGKGNYTLSIQLEGEGVYTNITFRSEVLAYAYVTSVCSPIICIVVSIVAMSGSCFGQFSRKNSMDLKTPNNNLQKERSQSFQWVYTPELLALAKKSHQDVLTSSSDSSSDETSEETPPPQKYSNSREDLQHVLHRMAEGKRERVLNDSTVMLKQVDLRRKNRYNSVIHKGSYIGPLLSRTKETALSERKYSENDSVDYGGSGYTTNPRIYRNSITYDGNVARVSYGDVTLERILPSRKQSNANPRSQYATEDEILSNNQNLSWKQTAKNYPTQYRNFGANLQTGFEIGGARLSRSSEDIRPKFLETATVHKASPRIPSMENGQNELSSEHYSLNKKQELPLENREISEEGNLKFYEGSKVAATVSSIPNDCITPDGSDFGTDSFDLSRTSSWAGEIIPINVSNLPAAKLSKLIPVPSPVVPDIQFIHLPKRSPRAAESTPVQSDANRNALKGERRENITSFRENANVRNKETMTEYPKTGQQSAKKYDLARVVTMTSISEEPITEVSQATAEATRLALCQEIAEVSNIRANNLKKKPLSTAYSESSKDSDRDRGNPVREITPKRKTVASCKSLRRMWSSDSTRELNLRHQVVDEDSLIGLSEEELIGRQNRIRSIRNAVQKRIQVREMAV